jgi:putative tryptophan/tyrosine transport system substrate-binding protein
MPAPELGADMRRREFISLLGGAATAWPLAARAQQAKVARIGALYIGTADAETFKKELREGFVNLTMSRGKTLRSSFALRKDNWIDFPGSRPNWYGSRWM